MQAIGLSTCSYEKEMYFHAKRNVTQAYLSQGLPDSETTKGDKLVLECEDPEQRPWECDKERLTRARHIHASIT